MMMVCASNVNQYFKKRISRPYTEYTRIQLWQRDEKGEMENMVMFFVCLHGELVCVFSSRNCCCYFCECSFVFPLRTHYHTLPFCYIHCMCSVLCMFKIHKS